MAEVLITLAIIGVVAAMTMPTLIQSHQEKVTVTRLKKFYSIFSQLHLLATEEYGDISTWCTDLDNAACQQKTHDIVVKYLKLSRDCGFNGGCWGNSVKNADGNYFSNYGAAAVNWSTFVLADGSTILLQNGRPVIGVYIDINGPKEPNTYGKDTFFVYMSDTEVLPGGVVDETHGNALNNYCSIQKPLRDGCMAWVIYNENMDYLHCDDLSWNGKTKCD